MDSAQSLEFSNESKGIDVCEAKTVSGGLRGALNYKEIVDFALYLAEDPGMISVMDGILADLNRL